METLYNLAYQTLERLSDLDERIWSFDEIAIYLQDGYDQFTTDTNCLFDITVIPNQPPVGNWQSDLERYIALQSPGNLISDNPMFRGSDREQPAQAISAAALGGFAGQRSVGLTNPAERDLAQPGTPSAVPGGVLPSTTLTVSRVTFNRRSLLGVGSAQMRRIDPHFETRQGDPQFFIFDNDGIFFLRVVPVALGNAAYDTISGVWGTRTYTDDSAVSVVTTESNGRDTGGYGILRWQTGDFPSGSGLGTPTQRHPDINNIRVEITRTGRDLTSYPSELPDAYDKYLVYWAMSQALRREGNGQMIELADHYQQRYQLGVRRFASRDLRHARGERKACLGGGGDELDTSFGLGDPQFPYPYSEV